jgi:hypothetical protein
MKIKSISPLKKLAEVKRFWIAACEYDGIDRYSSFVVFSSKNPYSGLYNFAMADYLKAARKGAQVNG